MRKFRRFSEQPAAINASAGKGLKVDVCENRAEGNVKGVLRWIKEWKLSFGS